MAIPKITNVLTFPTVHEVVGHGRARPSSSARSEQVEVEVVLAPLTDRFLFEPGVSTVSKWLGCEELASVPVGSRWRNGKAAGVRKVPEPFVGEGTVKAVSSLSLQGWKGAKGVRPSP